MPPAPRTGNDGRYKERASREAASCPLRFHDGWAAELDGASPIQRILHITLPYLYPVMSLMFVLQIIAVGQVFTEPFLLTTGGPGRETLTPSMHIYNRAFLRLDMGYAAAWSVMMTVFLVAFSIIYRAIDAYIKRNY